MEIATNLKTIISDEMGQYEDHKQNKVCRICLHGEEEPVKDCKGKFKKPTNNPLISPCDCTGSQQYIHYECLLKWIDNERLDLEGDKVINHIFVTNSCEICKAIYPDKVIHDGREFELFTVSRPEEKDVDYLILSVIGLASGKNIQVLFFEHSNQVTIGRNSSCDMQVNDASIS